MVGLGLGLGLSRSAGGGGVVGVSEIQANMAGGTVTNWQAIAEMLIYDKNGTEILAGLTAVGESATGFGDIVAGQYTSNSTYLADLSVANIADGVPDPDVAGDSPGNPEWSSDSSTELIIYVKPTTPIDIVGGGKIEIAYNVQGAYSQDPANVTFNFDGVLATPVTAPTGIGDNFGSISGTAYRWYRWTF